jgi:CubicO group peptidase (beta-lactamase class C family)
MVSAAVSTEDTVESRVRAFVESERRRCDVSGASVAAFDREGIRFAFGSGYADLSREEPATAETIFRAASISKLFTTTLVLRALEKRELELDRLANDYLDDEHQLQGPQGLPSPATIRHLLTHTSGLSVSWRGLDMGGVFARLINEGTVPRTLAESVAGMKAARLPGTPIVYANGAFNLLGYIIQRLRARPFEKVAWDEVLVPLGMTTSAFVDDPGRKAGVATPYGKLLGSGNSRKPAGEIKVIAAPAGGLVTSASELARFGMMVLRGGELGGNQILGAETLREANQFHARNHPEVDDGYGLGFAVTEWRGRRLAGHDGGLPGVATRIVLSPEDGVGVVVLTNNSNPMVPNRIARMTLEGLLDLEPEAVPGMPAGIPPGAEAEWTSFTKRVTGAYRMVDFSPPGVMKAVMGFTARPKLSHVADGVLVLEGTGVEAAYLYPDGEVGRYKLALPIANGSRAVIEERADGTHVWASILHLQKR